MSSPTFRPYGLIKSSIEEALYHRAHIANVYTGIADPKEHETSALMEVVLYSNIFTPRDNFIVNSQQPPASDSDKRCDLVIRYLEHGTQKIRVLCFAECKRSRTNQKFSLKALERQASDYCKECLEKEEDMPFVYAATMAGAHIRLWTYQRHEGELIPFWGSRTSGDWSQYKDVGNDQDGQDLQYWFGQMKQIPPTPHAGQSSHSYGTSNTAALGHQAPISSYQASTAGYQAPTTGYQASTSYQAATPGYQAFTSYQAATPGYQVPADYQAPATAPASSYQAPSFPTSGQDRRMSEQVRDDSEDDTQQAASSAGLSAV